MKNKPGLWIAALVMAVMIGGICVMSVGRAAENGYASWSFDFAFAKSASLKNTIELSAQEISSLKLEYGSKNIKVYPASGEKIIIKEYLYSNQSKAQATVTYPEKDQAVVTGGKLQTIVFFGFSSEKIEVYVPEKVLSVLSIQTGSGNIEYNGVDVGEASFQSGSGNIKIVDMKGDITVQTGSGNISGDSLCGKLSARAGSGNITVTGFAGSGAIATGSGNVRVEAASVTGDMEMQTGSGNIKLEIPEKLSFHLEIQTGSGSIKTDFDEILSYNKKGNSAEGNVGAMPEINIRLKANSGNVRVIY